MNGVCECCVCEYDWCHCGVVSVRFVSGCVAGSRSIMEQRRCECSTGLGLQFGACQNALTHTRHGKYCTYSMYGRGFLADNLQTVGRRQTNGLPLVTGTEAIRVEPPAPRDKQYGLVNAAFTALGHDWFWLSKG